MAPRRASTRTAAPKLPSTAAADGASRRSSTRNTKQQQQSLMIQGDDPDSSDLDGSLPGALSDSEEVLTPVSSLGMGRKSGGRGGGKKDGQGVSSPSTAPTSVTHFVMGKAQQRKSTALRGTVKAEQSEEEEEMGEESEVEVKKRPSKKLKNKTGEATATATTSSSARGTPKRAAATRARASGKMVLPKYVSSSSDDDSESDSDSEEVSSMGSDLRRAQDGSDSEEAIEEGDDEDFEDEEEEEVKPRKKGKGKAVVVASPKVTTNGKGKRKRVATTDEDPDEEDAEEESEAVMDDLAENSEDEAEHLRNAIAASLGKSSPEQRFKLVVGKYKSPGKGKSKSATAAVVVKKKKKAPAKSKAKGKGKQRKVSDDDEDDDEAEDSSYSAPASAAEGSSALSELSSEASSSDGESSTAAAPVRRRRAARGSNTGGGRRARKTWWEKNQEALEKHHVELRDVWGDLKANIAVVAPQKAQQPEGLSLRLLPFQLEGLDWMVRQEKGPWAGGMLADEMGMGKTVQTISLILSDRVPGDRHQTLVIAPTVAIMQWKSEFEKFTTGFKINVWHGGNRSSDMKEMKKYDVVLTSYAVLESSFRRQNSGFRRKGELIKESSILHKVKWHRVILDEAHNIKDRSCNTAKGAFALQAKYRWCLSGTPLQNRVGELYSLIRFLGADPFAYYFCKKCSCKALHWMFSDKRHCDECGHSPMTHTCWWNNEVLKPIQKYGGTPGSHGETAFKKLKILLDRMMLRRTKLERADDLGLPPRAIVVRRDYFTEEEEELYSSLYTDVRRKFSTFADAGTILNNYANLFQLITRMRQMANHPDLVLKSKTARDITSQIVDSDKTIHTCRLCLDEAEDAVISRCRHIFCRECIRQFLETATEQEPDCPTCHTPLSIDLSQDSIEDTQAQKARQGILDRLDPGKWRTSTKIEALVEELTKLQAEDHSIKSLVYSQYVTMLDLVERRLHLAGFKTARLTGSMTPEARDRTIKHFTNNVDVTVFLVSLKAGGVALNLVEASRVFIMDPWWNPAVELQAMDRVHRIGQYRPILVTRLIIENSIESRIVELQRKKESMVGAALGDDDQALGRLTPEDFGFLFSL